MKKIFPFALLLAAFSCTTPQTARTENTDNTAFATPAQVETIEAQTPVPVDPATEDSDMTQSAQDTTPVDLAFAKPAVRLTPAGMKASTPAQFGTEQPAAATEQPVAASVGEPDTQLADATAQPTEAAAPTQATETADEPAQAETAAGEEHSLSLHAGLADTPLSGLTESQNPGTETVFQPETPVLFDTGSTPAFAPDSLGTQGKKTRFLPMRRRMDREINKIKYVRKGEIMFGLTASYGTLDSDDTDLWLVIDNINLNASIFTVNPFVGYFFRDNLAIGARFGYSQVSGSLASADLNLGETNDINFGVNDITLKNKDISFGLFLRSYAGLDPKGHFGLFGELELSMSSGSSEFGYRTNGDLRQTFGDNTKVKLSFNPGMAVYIFPNVCSTISFGLGGLQYVKTTQKDGEGNRTGSRTYSNLRFRLNLADIRIGLTIHMWNKKKSL